MKMIPNSTKRNLTMMKNDVVKQMLEEQKLQAQYRATIVTSNDEQEVLKAKKLFDESVRHWEVLKNLLEEYEKATPKKWKVSPDTALVVLGNLLGIVLILKHEKIDAITTKALSFVLKGRV